MAAPTHTMIFISLSVDFDTPALIVIKI